MAFANRFLICLTPHRGERCWSAQSKTLTTLPTQSPESRIPAKPLFFLNPYIELPPCASSPCHLSFFFKHNQTRKSRTINVLQEKT